MQEGIELAPLYKRTEQLLRNYNSYKARVQNLEVDLAFIRDIPDRIETEDEAISGEYFARSTNEGAPSGHGDKTASVALRWLEQHSNNKLDMLDMFTRDTDTITQEISAIGTLLAKVDNAIASLSRDEQVIVKGFYIDNKPWYDIAHEVQYVERHCIRLRKRAIWYMSKSIFGCKVYG